MGPSPRPFFAMGCTLALCLLKYAMALQPRCSDNVRSTALCPHRYTPPVRQRLWVWGCERKFSEAQDADSALTEPEKFCSGYRAA